MGERFDPIEPDTLTLPQAAARLGIHRNTAARLVKEGRFPIPVLELGSKKVVSKVIFERYLLEGAAS